MKIFGGPIAGLGNGKNTDAITLSDDDLLEEIVKRQVNNPFPMDVFPSKIHDWIQFLTVTIQLEPCFVGLSMLEAASIAIGSALRGKMGIMVEKVSLYGCLVGYTSSGKSFALDMCMKPITKYQKIARQRKRRRTSGRYAHGCYRV